MTFSNLGFTGSYPPINLMLCHVGLLPYNRDFVWFYETIHFLFAHPRLATRVTSTIKNIFSSFPHMYVQTHT